MLPKQDLSKFGRGVRGQHAEVFRRGYSVTIRHADGSSTTRYILPKELMNQNDEQ